jgi:hypothetical protein
MLVCKSKEGEFLSKNQSVVNVYLNRSPKHTIMQNTVQLYYQLKFFTNVPWRAGIAIGYVLDN